jgi:hypothetical protein
VENAGNGAKYVEICWTVSAWSEGESGGSCILAPVETNSEKGIRNFADAASHSQ